MSTDDTGASSDANSTDGTPEVVVVPVNKFQVNISFDDLLTKMSEEAESAAAPDSGEALETDAAERLQRLGELARQLKTELSQVDPAMMNRFKQRRSTSG